MAEIVLFHAALPLSTPGLAEDAAATEALWRRVLALLAGLGG